MKRAITWIVIGCLALFVGRTVFRWLSPTEPAALAASPDPAPQERRERSAATTDLNPYVDAPFMPIGRLAMLYGRRNGYVVCDELLRDDRPVSVQFAMDSPVEMAGVFSTYGYDVVQRGAATYICGRTDPFGGVQVWLSARSFVRYGVRDWQPMLEWYEGGRLVAWPLTTIAAAHNLEIAVSGCTYSLNRAGGSPVRVLTDPLCLANSRGPNSAAGSSTTSAVQSLTTSPQGYHVADGRTDQPASSARAGNDRSTDRTSG